MSTFRSPVKRKIQEVTVVEDEPASKRVQTQLVARVNRLSKAQELKTFDTTFSVTQVAFDTNNATALGLVLQGDTRITRDGSKLLATSIDIRMMVRQETTPPTFGAQLRVILIKAKQRFTPSTSVSTTVGGVLENAGTLSEPNSPFERNNRSHFTVLHDKMYYVNGGDSGPTGFNIHIKKRLNHVIEYDESSTATEKGQLWMLLFTNRSAASADGPDVGYTSRLFFKDS